MWKERGGIRGGGGNFGFRATRCRDRLLSQGRLGDQSSPSGGTRVRLHPLIWKSIRSIPGQFSKPSVFGKLPPPPSNVVISQKKEGEGNMSDGKPSHADWNGAGLYSVRKTPPRPPPRGGLIQLCHSAPPWPPRSCSQQLRSCRSAPRIQDEPSAASALSPNENRPLLGTCWNVPPPPFPKIPRGSEPERGGGAERRPACRIDEGCLG